MAIDFEDSDQDVKAPSPGAVMYRHFLASFSGLSVIDRVTFARDIKIGRSWASLPDGRRVLWEKVARAVLRGGSPRRA
jgi:hypothetical protein